MKQASEFSLEEKIAWLTSMLGEWSDTDGNKLVIERDGTDFRWYWEVNHRVGLTEPNTIYGIYKCFESLYDISKGTGGITYIRTGPERPRVTTEDIVKANKLINWVEHR